MMGPTGATGTTGDAGPAGADGGDGVTIYPYVIVSPTVQGVGVKYNAASDQFHLGVLCTEDSQEVRVPHPNDADIGKVYLISDVQGDAAENNITVTVSNEAEDGVVTAKMQGHEDVVIAADWGNVKIANVTRGGEGGTPDRMWVIVSSHGVATE